MSGFPRIIFRETSGTKKRAVRAPFTRTAFAHFQLSSRFPCAISYRVKKPAGKGMAAPFPHAFRMHFFGLRKLARRAADSSAAVTVINTLFLLYTTRRHFTTPQRSFSASSRWEGTLGCRPNLPEGPVPQTPFTLRGVGCCHVLPRILGRTTSAAEITCHTPLPMFGCWVQAQPASYFRATSAAETTCHNALPMFGCWVQAQPASRWRSAYCLGGMPTA